MLRMTAPAAPGPKGPESPTAATGAATGVSRADPEALRAARARGAAAARRGAARTPFYDHLMSMIDETAVENRRAQHGDAASGAAEPRWRLSRVLTCAAGLV